MSTSYVGIASHAGLVAFLPEHAGAVRAVTAAAYAEQRSARGVCWWAVIGEDEAAVVRRELAAGEPARALVALNQLASRIGTILPSDLRNVSAYNAGAPCR